MPLDGPHLIRDGRAVPLSAEQFAAMRGGRPIASAPRRPAAPVAAAPKQPPAQSEAETRRKAVAFDAQMAAGSRAYSRRDMLARHGIRQDPAAAKAGEADRLAGMPTSIGAAKGDTRAFAKADMQRQVAAVTGEAGPGAAAASTSRKSMLAELKKQGLESVR